MRILFLSSWFPYPVDNGSRLRISSLLEALVSRHRVHLVTMDEKEPAASGILRLEEEGIEHHWLPSGHYSSTSISALLGSFSPRPRSLVAVKSRHTAEWIRSKLEKGEYDLVVASQLKSAVYIEHLKQVPAIFDEVECGFFLNRARYARLPMKLRQKMTNWKLRRYLQRLLPAFSACTVVSEVEKEILQEWVPDYSSVHVIPNCLRMEEYTVDPGPRESSAIFPGSLSFAPNRKGLEWFEQKVLPLIARRVEDFQVYVTGSGQPVRSLDPRLVLTGDLSRRSLRDLFGRVKVCIAPLFEGGGTRFKILESMAFGVPVVSTPLGAEGLAVSSGNQLWLACSAAEFAEAVVRLLTRPDEGERVASNARALVVDQYDCSRVLPKFLDLVDETGGKQR